MTLIDTGPSRAIVVPNTPMRDAATWRTSIAVPFTGQRVIVTSRLADLRAYWPGIASHGDAQHHVFQCAELLEIWLDTIGKARGVTPCFVAVLDERGSPLLLLPLCIERSRGVKVLRFIDGGVFDYNVPVLFPAFGEQNAAKFSSLWEQILRALPAFDLLHLEKMPDRILDRPNPMLLLGAGREAVSAHVRSCQVSEAGTPEPRQGRANRRKLKKLCELGSVEIVAADTAERYRAFFDAMVTHKERRFVETIVPGFAATPGKLAFYEQATQRLAGSGVVHLSALKVGDEIIASHWGLYFQNRLYQLMPGHAGEDWARYSPGRLLNNFLAAWSDERCAVMDFGIGDEPYKADYCDIDVPLYGLAVARTHIGAAHLQYQRLMEKMRATAIWQAVRPLKWKLKRAFR